MTAAKRKSAAARLDDRLVRDDSTLPPDILLPGARQSQDVKCLALGHARRSVPHSPTSLSDRDGPIPWIWVRSTPRTPYNAARTSNEGVLTCLVLVRGRGNSLGSCAVVIPPFLTGLSRRIHAAVFSFIAGVIPPMAMLGRSWL